jgi:hypothetical protein
LNAVQALDLDELDPRMKAELSRCLLDELSCMPVVRAAGEIENLDMRLPHGWSTVSGMEVLISESSD